MKKTRNEETARQEKWQREVTPSGNALACIMAPNHSRPLTLLVGREARRERRELRVKFGDEAVVH